MQKILIFCLISAIYPSPFLLAQQEKPQLPTDLQAFDTPNDKGETISLTWKKSPSEEKAIYYYIVYISKTPQGPWTTVAARFPSVSQFKSDAPEYFWFIPDNKNYHWIKIDPAEFFHPFLEIEVKKLEDVTTGLERIYKKVRTVKEVKTVDELIKTAESLKITDEDINKLKAIQPGLDEKDEIKALNEAIDEISEAKARANAIYQTCISNLNIIRLRIAKGDPFKILLDEILQIIKKNLPWFKKTLKDCRTRFEAQEKRIRSRTYHFKLAMTWGENKEEHTKNEIQLDKVVSAEAGPDIFHFGKLNNFLFAIAFSVIILGFIGISKKKQLFLRKIAGIDAIDEAIGRATEMGRPVYYLTGRDSISSISTIAASIILGDVSQKIASYGATLKVPHTDPIVTTVCQEITKEAYTRAGRPDLYKQDINFFVTVDQFAYTAAVDGMMLREKPAACFYMGYYYAEALILAETGASTGAIQVAGTDSEHQLPFFVAACDYTLIGEELYAASAYLSKEPVMVATLRGQDIGKLFLMIVIVIGVILLTMAVFSPALSDLAEYVMGIFRPLE